MGKPQRKRNQPVQGEGGPGKTDPYLLLNSYSREEPRGREKKKPGHREGTSWDKSKTVSTCQGAQ